MRNIIQLPVVTDDFDGEIENIDTAIKIAAQNFNFSLLASAPTFEEIYQVPDFVYKLIRHYTMRGFICTYDGDEGQIVITWNHPNMSWLEQKEITESKPEMIPNLGLWFRAGFLYLCMTNGNDLRSETDLTLAYRLDKMIRDAAVHGNTKMYFDIPGASNLPREAFENLFVKTFDDLREKGFLISFDNTKNSFFLTWGNTLNLSILDGTSLSTTVS